MRQKKAVIVRYFRQRARNGLIYLFLALALVGLPHVASAVPTAEFVIDARTGKVLHERNADARLHPASLTKMMTLYIAFEAIENGEISLDTMVRISKKAAAEPPSKLGMRPGQRIKLRYLIRAAAIKSANDAATAIGEAIEGSEAAFARRMNRTAKAMGMSRTTFKNANGLTENGHLSTARDMTTLGRHLFYDFPEYYNLFSRITADAGGKTVTHSNRRFLNSYPGADGIKTGYTSASGFNLVASAQHGNKRIIATVFGGRSTSARNDLVAKLMDQGFRKAPTRVATLKPTRPPYAGHVGKGGAPAAGKTIRVAMTLNKSPRPKTRPAPAVQQPPEALLIAIQDTVRDTVQDVIKPSEPETLAATPEPKQKPAPEVKVAALAPPPEAVQPRARPESVTLASLPASAVEDPATSATQEVVTRMSTSGGRYWGINVGRYNSRYQAERVLLKTALKEINTLDDALRKVSQTSRGFDANFVGMTQEEAALACRRLQARGDECTSFGPS